MNTKVAPELGRKGASVLRNRAALLVAAQKVLARLGRDATIEDFAVGADVSVSTIYQHFENKDALISSAVLSAFADWESWISAQVAEFEDPIVKFLIPMRLFVRVENTHPEYAALVRNNLDVVSSQLPLLTSGLANNILSLAAAGAITCDHIELRTQNLVAVILRVMQNCLENKDFGATKADLSLKLALEGFGIPTGSLQVAFAAPLHH